MLPLWFKDPKDYDLISGSDKLSIVGLNDFKPGQEITVKGKRADGSEYSFQTTNTINEGQWAWFQAGSALNKMKKDAGI
jgi:aconitate hydratase